MTEPVPQGFGYSGHQGPSPYAEPHQPCISGLKVWRDIKIIDPLDNRSRSSRYSQMVERKSGALFAVEAIQRNHHRAIDGALRERGHCVYAGGATIDGCRCLIDKCIVTVDQLSGHQVGLCIFRAKFRQVHSKNIDRHVRSASDCTRFRCLCKTSILRNGPAACPRCALPLAVKLTEEIYTSAGCGLARSSRGIGGLLFMSIHPFIPQISTKA